MPEMRYYLITQERQVKVVAYSAADAVLVAEAAFTNGQHNEHTVIDGPAVWGNTIDGIREIDIHVREARK